MVDPADPSSGDDRISSLQKEADLLYNQSISQKEIARSLAEINQLIEKAISYKQGEDDKDKDRIRAIQTQLDGLKAQRELEKEAYAEIGSAEDKIKAQLDEQFDRRKASLRLLERDQPELLEKIRKAEADINRERDVALSRALITESPFAKGGALLGEIEKNPIIGLASQLEAASAKLSAAVGGGGMGPGMATSRLLGGVPAGAMDPVERMQLLTDVAFKAPTAFKNTEEGMTTLIGTLANFGLQTKDSIDILITATRNLNLDTGGLTKAYNEASILSQQTGMHTKEVGDHLLNMGKSLRGVGADLGEATNIMAAFSRDITILGQSTTQVEIAQMAERIATGLGQMPMDKALGIMSFATGMPVTSIGEKDFGKFFDKPFESARRVFDQITSTLPGDFATQSMAAQKVSELLGINATTPKEVLLLRNVMENSALTEQGMHDKLAELGDPQKRTAAGIEKLTNMIEPLKQIENHTKNIMQIVAGPLAGALGTWMGRDVGTMAAGAVHAGTAITQLALALGAGSAIRAGGAALLATAGPPIAFAGAFAAGGYATYKGLEHIVNSQDNQNNMGRVP